MKRIPVAASSILHLDPPGESSQVMTLYLSCSGVVSAPQRAIRAVNIRIGADKSDNSSEAGRISSENPSGQ